MAMSPRLLALSELGHSTESGLTAVDSRIRTLTDRGWLLTELSWTAGAHANDVPSGNSATVSRSG